MLQNVWQSVIRDILRVQADLRLRHWTGRWRQKNGQARLRRAISPQRDTAQVVLLLIDQLPTLRRDFSTDFHRIFSRQRRREEEEQNGQLHFAQSPEIQRIHIAI